MFVTATRGMLFLNVFWCLLLFILFLVIQFSLFPFLSPLSLSQGWTGTSCNISLIENNNQMNSSSTSFITPSSSLTDTSDTSSTLPVMKSITSLLSATNDVSLQDIPVLTNDDKSINDCNGTFNR